MATCTYTAANAVSSVTCNTGYYLSTFTATLAGASSFAGATCLACGNTAAAYVSCTSTCPGTSSCSSTGAV